MEINDNKNKSEGDIILLTKIAADLGKKLNYLQKLARKNLITAEKRNNKWYANKEQVKKELRKIMWIERKFKSEEYAKEIFASLSVLSQFFIIYAFIYLVFFYNKNLTELQITIDLSKELTVFFITLLAFLLRALSKTTRIMDYAGNFWKQIMKLDEQFRDLNERLEILEKRYTQFHKDAEKESL